MQASLVEFYDGCGYLESLVLVSSRRHPRWDLFGIRYAAPAQNLNSLLVCSLSI